VIGKTPTTEIQGAKINTANYSHSQHTTIACSFFGRQIRAEKVSILLNNEQNPEECDATKLIVAIQLGQTFI